MYKTILLIFLNFNPLLDVKYKKQFTA